MQIVEMTLDDLRQKEGLEEKGWGSHRTAGCAEPLDVRNFGDLRRGSWWNISLECCLRCALTPISRQSPWLSFSVRSPEERT